MSEWKFTTLSRSNFSQKSSQGPSALEGSFLILGSIVEKNNSSFIFYIIQRASEIEAR
jgi:hypothetical protein